MQIYVGNLPADTTEEDLKELFTPFGTIKNVLIVVDKKTGQSQQYGFVEMPVKSEARAAIDGLRGKDLGGNPMRVKALKPDDEFHQHAATTNRTAGAKGSPLRYRGDVGNRGSGAIRRGGKRGS